VISAATLRDVVGHVGLDAARIAVIADCHDPVYRPSPKPFDAACPTLLQVGARPYKNVPRVVEAIRGLDCRFVIVGAMDDDLRRRIEEAGIRYENPVDLPLEGLYRRYCECDVVTFVSTGEGFGVPIIEAQAVGRPVVTSNRPPMSDVAGPGACLADPDDAADIRAAVLRILRDEAYRASLVEAGFRNAAAYSPARIAAEYFRLYEGILSETGGRCQST
jgi:glycosyltransferase involved in cell wall biosynthesis